MSPYTVVAGDTLWAIGQRFNCSVSELMNANPGVIPEQLQIGQLLNIPRSQETGTNNLGSVLPPVGPGSTHGRFDSTLSNAAPSPIRELRDIINQAAQATNMPADLIGAVIYQESDGAINVNSTINAGNGGLDSGLMQVSQYTAAELQQKYPYRFTGLTGSAKDVMLGSSYLKDMYDTRAKHDWGITLRAYNSGPNGVDESNLSNLPAGTGDRTYVDKVLRFWIDISQGNSLPTDHYESIYGRGF